MQRSLAKFDTIIDPKVGKMAAGRETRSTTETRGKRGSSNLEASSLPQEEQRNNQEQVHDAEIPKKRQDKKKTPLLR